MSLTLFAVYLGGKPQGRNTEQHDVFFGVAERLEDLFDRIKAFWPEAPKIHVDAYMCIRELGAYNISIFKKGELSPADTQDEDGRQRLYFINLGGYRQGHLGEIHKRLFVVAENETEAVRFAKTDPFFHEGVAEGKAVPHIDDRALLDQFEDEKPIDVGEAIASQGYVVRLSRVRPLASSSEVYPEVVVTGFLKVE